MSVDRVNKGALLAVILVANFMVTLDIAIVNVALPSLQLDLGVDTADLQWVVTMYALMLGGFLLLGGRAADLLGRRNVLVAGLVLFTGASLVAGLSNDLALLIVARAAQGLGAALVVPSALSILANTFAEGEERIKAIGAFGAVGGSAATIGVIAGGALTSGPGWEWIFFLNVPIGVVLVGLVMKVIPAEAPSGCKGADVLGALLVTSGLLTLVYGINKGPEFGWDSGRTIGLLAGSAALLFAFLVVESNVSSPLLPLSMFKRRTLSAANLVAALVCVVLRHNLPSIALHAAGAGVFSDQDRPGLHPDCGYHGGHRGGDCAGGRPAHRVRRFSGDRPGHRCRWTGVAVTGTTGCCALA